MTTDDGKMPLDAMRLAAIYDTAKFHAGERCRHQTQCPRMQFCGWRTKRSPLSAPAIEMVAEIKMLRKRAGLDEDGN